MSEYNNFTDDNYDDTPDNQQLSTSIEVHYSCGHTGIERLHRIKATSRDRRIQWLEDYGICKDCRQKKINGELYLLNMDSTGLPTLVGTDYEIRAAELIRMMFAETCLTPNCWRHIPSSWGDVIDIRVLRNALESLGWRVERTPLTAPYDPAYLEKTTLTFGHTCYYADDKYPLYFLNKSICRYALMTQDIAVWWRTAKRNKALQDRLIVDWATWMTKQANNEKRNI